MFNKSKIAEHIKVPVTFPHIYRDESGNPITFNFTLRIETGEDADAIQQQFAGKMVSQHEQRVERLARLLVEAPPEFEDFEVNGDLPKAVRSYFGDRRMELILSGLFTNYGRAVNPAELFR